LIKRLVPLAAVAAALIAAGCGSTTQIANTSQPTATQTTTVVVEHAAPARRAKPKRAFAGCGGYVEAVAGTTSCDFANNVFYEFFEAQPEREFPVYSPATGESYEVRCTGQSVVTCTGGAGAKVRFPMSAMSVYTERDATAYASSHDLGPEAPVSAQPAGSFCDAHACIDNFDNGTGYIVRCADGEWSHSGGRPGACSYHGGETGDTYP
jgi:hypothetical protein